MVLDVSYLFVSHSSGFNWECVELESFCSVRSALFGRFHRKVRKHSCVERSDSMLDPEDSEVDFRRILVEGRRVALGDKHQRKPVAQKEEQRGWHKKWKAKT